VACVLDLDSGGDGPSLRLYAVHALVATLLVGGVTPRTAPFNKMRVTFRSGDLTLAAYAYHPDGDGPFPTVIWNHGSEKNPGGGPQFDSVAAVFVPAGFAVFAPVRRGHGGSEGTYIVDTLDAASSRGEGSEGALVVRLHETEQLADQLAGVASAKTLPFVDARRLVVAGCSFGGIQTLLAAERADSVGFRAALPISPASLMWVRTPELQQRLKDAVRRIRIPVLLIMPPKDASLEPARVLGAEAARLGRKQFRTRIYPPTMPDSQQVHCFGGTKGFHNWGKDAVEFFRRALK
jgi:carboxymethylenebutenolidase